MANLADELRLAREGAISKFIIDHTRDLGYPPSVREIAAYLHVSLATAQGCVTEMVKSGRVTRTPGVGRSIRVNEQVLPEQGEVL